VIVILYGLENTFTDMKMELKTQINILTSSSKEGVYYFTWKDEIDLFRQIENISESFRSNSSDAITPHEIITTSNKITEIPGFLSKLKKLEKLSLQKNQVDRTAKSKAVSKLEDALPDCWVVA